MAKQKKLSILLNVFDVAGALEVKGTPEGWYDMPREERTRWLTETCPTWFEAREEDHGLQSSMFLERFPLINTKTYETRKELSDFREVERQAISNMKAEFYNMPECFGVAAPTPELLHVVMNHPDMKKRIEEEARKRVLPHFEGANKLLKEARDQSATLIALRKEHVLRSCPAIIKELIYRLAEDRWNHADEIISGMQDLVEEFQPLIKQLKEIRECVVAAQLPTTLAKVDAILNPEKEGPPIA